MKKSKGFYIILFVIFFIVLLLITVLMKFRTIPPFWDDINIIFRELVVSVCFSIALVTAIYVVLKNIPPKAP